MNDLKLEFTKLENELHDLRAVCVNALAELQELKIQHIKESEKFLSKIMSLMNDFKRGY